MDSKGTGETIMQIYVDVDACPVAGTREQVAGFKDVHTGKLEEVMLIKGPEDLEFFKKMYGIDEEIAKEY